MSWGSKRIQGVDYDLTHLDGFDMIVTPQYKDAPSYSVRVGFGAHTFTKALEAGDTPDLHFQDGGQTRCFCPLRHSYSMHLPKIIQTSGTAYFGNQGEKYLLVENLAGLNAPYVVAFKVAQANLANVDATMFVVSAHERPGLPKKLPAIGMGTLVSLTVQGKPIIRPKK